MCVANPAEMNAPEMFDNYWLHRKGVAIYRKWWQRKYRARYSNLVVTGDTPVQALSMLDYELERCRRWGDSDNSWRQGVVELFQILYAPMVER